jgi:hypothetical protein
MQSKPTRYFTTLVACAIAVSFGCGGKSTSPDAAHSHGDSGDDLADGPHHGDAFGDSDSPAENNMDTRDTGDGAEDALSGDVSTDGVSSEGDGGSHVCTPDAGCGRCTTGVCCGGGCCIAGEWCDQSGASPMCRCAQGPACLAPNICMSAFELPAPNMCGNVCCLPGNGSGVSCPISRRSAKKDIVPVDAALSAQLHRDLLGIDLATYRYRSEAPDAPRHLGFIIDDLKTSVPVNPSGSSVDLYAYTSMAVAAIKEQELEIAKLRDEVSTGVTKLRPRRPLRVRAAAPFRARSS